MRILRYSDPGFCNDLQALNRRAEPAAAVQQTVADIIGEVRARGDAAVLEFTRKFGGPAFGSADLLRVTSKELQAAGHLVDARTQRAMADSHENVRAFAMKSLRGDWRMKNREGAEVGERFTPFPRVGLYVPGGTAPLVSTAIMTCTLAAAAGVPEIVVTTPSDKEGRVNPALLCALELAGATEVYKAGGAQAIAAMAFGTETIPPVVKIFGPGNSYVVEAKRQVFGRVAIDLMPGPSEILVVADGDANAAWIAADILAQAEHGPESVIGFLTPSEGLLKAVEEALILQFSTLRRRAQLGPALDNGAFLGLTRDMDQAIAIANDFAPEHLALMAAEERLDVLAARLTTAGAIFLGGWSPVAAGDFLAGPSHTLPTGGAGKSFAGLTVDQFQRRTSLIRFDRESLRRSVATIEAFSDMEGLDAHGRSATIRYDGTA